MTSRIAEFIEERSKEVYPEPRSDGHDYITKEMAAVVAKLLPAGAPVLDVGSGQGPALEWFTKEGFDIQGITLSKDDVRKCLEDGFCVYECDMNDISSHFSEGVFACVWARHVLEHSVIPFFTLTEFARVLKPGGILYVEVPAPDTACNHDCGNANHYSVLGKRMWESLIQRSGFEIISNHEMKLETGAGPDIYFGLIARKL